MPNKVSRRKFIKSSLGTFISIIGAGSGGYFYAHEIEPRLLTINSHIIMHRDIPKSFDGFKIVQFSDTHLGFQYDLKQFRKLLEKITSLHPDVIFFTGDLMDAPNQYPYAEEIIPMLKDLKAPFGKFSIYGNHDHGGYGSDIYRNMMELADFKLLLNESDQIRLKDGSTIFVMGIDDAMLGTPDFQATLAKVPKNQYKILLSHAPDLADQAAQYDIQLQLSGHSHGGQIQIPFIGALITPPYAKKYRVGFYEINGQHIPLTLYVNRGIGTTRLPFRFMAKPELTVLTLKTQI